MLQVLRKAIPGFAAHEERTYAESDKSADTTSTVPADRVSSAVFQRSQRAFWPEGTRSLWALEPLVSFVGQWAYCLVWPQMPR